MNKERKNEIRREPKSTNSITHSKQYPRNLKFSLFNTEEKMSLSKERLVEIPIIPVSPFCEEIFTYFFNSSFRKFLRCLKL